MPLNEKDVAALRDHLRMAQEQQQRPWERKPRYGDEADGGSWTSVPLDGSSRRFFRVRLWKLVCTKGCAAGSASHTLLAPGERSEHQAMVLVYDDGRCVCDNCDEFLGNIGAVHGSVPLIPPPVVVASAPSVQQPVSAY